MLTPFSPRQALGTFCAIAALLTPQIALAQDGGGTLHSEGITRALSQQDPRLLKPVSLVSLRIPVGELMERLSRQTGVTLDADEDSGAADAEVAVSLRAVPLADALDALWSLVGYQKATWEWQRTGAAPAFHYHLLRTAEARLFAASIPEQIQQDFEAEADAHIADAQMTPEQMQEAAKTDPDVANMLSSPQQTPGLPRQVQGLRTFEETLSPEQRQAVLEGQNIPMPVSSLSDAGRQFVHDEWIAHHATTRNKNGVLTLKPQPDTLYFYAEASGNELTPTMYIQMGDLGGYSYIGALPFQDKWAKKLAALWMLPSDAAADPAEARRCQPVGAVPSPRTYSSGADVLARDLIRLTPGAGVSFIARLPTRQRDLAPPAGQTVADYLQHCQEYPSLARKWRHGVLLLTYPAWFREEGDKTKAPWAVIRHLRDAEAAAPSGVLSLGDLTWAAARTNTAQMQDLTRWFPGLAFCGRWHDFLAMLDGDPSLAGHLEATQGALWPNPIWPTLPTTEVPVQAQVDDGTVQRARLSVTTKTSTPGASQGDFSFEALTLDGKRVAGAEYVWPAHQYVSSVAVFSQTVSRATP